MTEKPEETPKSPNEKVDTGQFATILEAHAGIMALVSFCMRIAAKVGLTEIDGLTLGDWWRAELKVRRQGLLEATEDGDPALAARLQQYIDRFDPRKEQAP